MIDSTRTGDVELPPSQIGRVMVSMSEQSSTAVITDSTVPFASDQKQPPKSISLEDFQLRRNRFPGKRWT